MAAKRRLRPLVRLFRLWGVYARLDLMFLTRDLPSFLLYAISDTLLNVAAVTGMLMLAARFSGIGIWSQGQFVFLLGYAALVDGIVSVFFSYNVAYISRRLGRGQFDHTLIQPQPIWMSLLTEGFSPALGLPMLLPGLGLMIWALQRLPLSITPLWLLYLALNLAASVTVVLAFQFLWGSLAFWAPRAAEEISSSSLRMITWLKSYPLDGVSHWLRGGLLTILPVGFVAWTPSKALVGLTHAPGALWDTPGAAVLAAVIAVTLFSQGMRHYASTGSQRYSDFGHRR